MKKKFLAMLLTLIAAVALLTVGASAAEVDTSWYDESVAEYQIGTAAALRGLAQLVNGDGVSFAEKTIKLTATIDLEGQAWTPIGTSTSTSSNPFRGTFDGNGNTIENLKIDTEIAGAGLFGYTDGAANAYFAEAAIWNDNDIVLTETAIAETNYETVIKNLKLESVDVTGKQRVGALIGYAKNTYVLDCDVTGAVKGEKYLGGVIGQMDDCVVKGCDNAANVTGFGESDAYNYGGVIGAARGSKANAVITCKNTGALNFTLSAGPSGCGGAGGIVGQYSVAAIVVYACENSGNITVTATPVNNTERGKAVAAGIVGTTGGAGKSVIADCENSGGITTTDDSQISGQLSGIASNFGPGLIYNCTNSGDITGTALYVGGICAAPSNTIEISACANEDAALTNATDATKVSDIVAYCGGAVTYSNMTFTDGAALDKALPVEGTGSVALDSVAIGNQTFNVIIGASGNLTITGNDEIVIPEETIIQTLTITGEGAKVTNEGTINEIVCDAVCTVINDGTVNNGITCNAACTVTNNGVINGVVSIALNAADCVVTNGEGATAKGIKINAANCEITNNGTVSGADFYANATFTNNGTVETPSGSKTTMRIWTDGVTATVNNNGTISNDGYYVYWIQVNNAKFIVKDSPDAGYVISGVPDNDHSSIERVVTFDGTNTYVGSSIERATIVAKIGDETYTDLQVAANAAASGQTKTITMITDVDLGQTPLMMAEGVTLDLNGNTLTGAVMGTLKTSGGTFITTEGHKQIVPTVRVEDPELDRFVSDDVTVSMTMDGEVQVIDMKSGEVSLAQSWYAADGKQRLVISNGATFTIPSGMWFYLKSTTEVQVDGTLDLEDETSSIQMKAGATMTAPAGLNVVPADAGYAVVYNNGTYEVVPAYTLTLTAPDGATVVVKDGSGAEVTAEQDGSYVVINGDYTVTVTKDGYEPYEETITISGADYPLTVELEEIDDTPVEPDPPVPTAYRITVAEAENGTVETDYKSARAGRKVTVTVAADEKYVVKGLTVTTATGREIAVTDKGDGTYTFTMPGAAATITAEFAVDLPFTDIEEDHQFYEAIEWAYVNNLMLGKTETTFDRVGDITRQQAWRVLARIISGEDPENMAAAKVWAMEQGITDGTRPGEAATREEFITMMWIAFGAPEADTAILEKFSDADAISAETQTAMAWAVEVGITEGYEDGTVRPAATTTRGAFAAVLYRYLAK